MKPNSLFAIEFSRDYDPDSMMTPDLLAAIFDLNVLELRIENLITAEPLFNTLVEKVGWNVKVRDLEVLVSTSDQVKTLLLALKDNFMIKTVGLSSLQWVDQEVNDIGYKFIRQRVGVEILMKSKDRKLKKRNKGFEAFYP